MESLSRSARSRRRFAWRLFLICWLAAMAASRIPAQSTFGAILGIVRDATGAIVQNAHVTLENTGTQATLVAEADESGNYAFRNVDVGSYKLTIAAPGFETESLPQIALAARETRRIDATLKPGAQSETVVVKEDADPVITTDVSNLAETKLGDELADLPRGHLLPLHWLDQPNLHADHGIGCANRR